MSKMKRFVKDDQLVLIAQSGIEIVEYVALDCQRHIVKWTSPTGMPMSAFADDDNLHRITRYGLRNAFDAYVENRHEAALQDMKAGNPTSTHLIREFKTIAA